MGTYHKWVGGIAMVVCISGIVYSLLHLHHKPGMIHGIHFILLTLVWIIMPAVIPAICIAVFTFMTFIAAREKWILFTDEGIHYPSFPPRNLKWEDVQMVKIKDRVLTVEFGKNRFIQMIIKNHEEDIDEPAFNAFCDRQIKNSHSQSEWKAGLENH